MNSKLIISIAIAILLIIFALQNTGEVVIKFFKLQFNGSLSLFIILGILIGAIIGSLFTIWVKKSREKIKDAKKQDEVFTPNNEGLNKG